MIFRLSIFTDIGIVIVQALRALVARIAATLYGYIIDLYDVFILITRVKVLDNEYIQLIYNRVGIILGLFMLFRLSFALIQSLIDPDKLTDQKTGFTKIIIRCVISVVLLGVTPSLFKYAREFQNLVVGANNDSNNVIYRIIVVDDTIQDSSSSFGRTLATNLFFSFFRERKDAPFYGGIKIKDIDEDHSQIIEIEKYETLRDEFLYGEKEFSELVEYISLRIEGSYVFEWDIILSVGTGIGVLWILVNYCISVATRVIQLAFLQLIAPIPILSYIGNPGDDGAFKKWLKQCTSTYLDLFMRLAIIYFIVTISKKALDVMNSGFLEPYGVASDSFQYTLVRVFIIIGLLMFGKKVPELLKELFPGNGSFDLGIKSPKDLLNSIPGGSLAKGAVGIGAGFALGATGRVVGGLAHGAVNMKNAWKNSRGLDWKTRLGKVALAGGKGLGMSALGGVAGGFGGGYRNRKGGVFSGIQTGWGSFKKPIQGDIESWVEHKNTRAAAIKGIKERNQMLARGEALYNSYGDDIGTAFTGVYGQTYRAKQDASTARNEASATLREAQSEMDAIYAREFSGKKYNGVEYADEAAAAAARSADITAAQERLTKAESGVRGAEAAYTRAEEAHKMSQERYTSQYAMEQAYKAYTNYTKTPEYEEEQRKIQELRERKEAAEREAIERRTSRRNAKAERRAAKKNEQNVENLTLEEDMRQAAAIPVESTGATRLNGQTRSAQQTTDETPPPGAVVKKDGVWVDGDGNPVGQKKGFLGGLFGRK